MKVAVAADKLDLVVRNSLFDRAPASCKLDGCLHALRAGVHREESVISEISVDIFLEPAESVVVESSRGKAELACLVFQRLYDSRMAVSLVDSGIRREKVIILLALHLPDENPCSLFESDR